MARHRKTPALIVRGLSVPERFWFYVVPSPECWEWVGPKQQGGYGVFSWKLPTDEKQQSRPAHRYAYERLVGPIPEGLEIDHLCRNRACVNPAHMEAVTRTENVRRSDKATGERSYNGRKKHCRHGHPYSEENTYFTPDGRRQCRTCRRQAMQRFHEKKSGKPNYTIVFPQVSGL